MKNNKIMKTQITILTLVFAITFANAQNIIAPAIINNNTIWDADTVFLNSDVEITNGKSLTIEPGVIIIANGWYGIDCQGQLLAQGTPDDSIIFTIADTTGFSNIDTTLGGWKGVIFDNTTETNDSSIFDYCIFEYGKGGGFINKTKYGGAIYTNFFSKLIISNSKFYKNYAIRGGAIYFMYSNGNIINNKFIQNYASDAGAIYINSVSSSLIYKNIFIDNHGGLPYDFGDGHIVDDNVSAIVINGQAQDIIINKVKVISNEFYNHGSYNGILYENSFHTVVENNIFCNNKELVLVCGVSISKSIFSNNTFVNNDSRYMMTILMNTTATFKNNIIINDLAGSEVADLIYCENSSLSEDYSNIQYNYIQYGDIYNIEGHDNIMGNVPQFINPSPSLGYDDNWQDYDWRLQNTSPCVNAGTIDTSGLDLPEEDAFGNPRIYGGRIDIGAYENQSEVWNNIFDLENSAKITFYPNPVGNSLQLTINSEQLLKEELQIFDINGKLVKQLTVTSLQFTVKVEDLETGVYYLRIGELSKEFIKL
jgi:hypothetical protein